MSPRLSKQLFRSILRWNRALYKYAVDRSARVPEFSLDLVALLGLPKSKYLTESFKRGSRYADTNKALRISNVEGLQALTFHSFRNFPLTSEHIDLGFDALKALNTLGVELRTTVDSHVETQNTNPSLVKFKVGEVVQHNDLSFRGVVIGWMIHDDPDGPQQILKILPDLMDYNEFATQEEIVDHSSPSSGPTYNSSQFSIVKMDELKRIFHHNTYRFFDKYCAKSGTFIPNKILSYSYPNDCIVPTAEDARVPTSVTETLQCVSLMGKKLLALIDTAGSNAVVDEVLQDIRRSATLCVGTEDGAVSTAAAVVAEEAASDSRGRVGIYTTEDEPDDDNYITVQQHLNLGGRYCVQKSNLVADGITHGRR